MAQSGTSDDPSITISLLADCPETVPTLAQWFHDEWRSHYGERTVADVEANFEACLCRDELPIALVARAGDVPCGTAALMAESLTTHPHLTPWLTALYVAPPFRRQGIATRLQASVADMARDFGFERIYAGTASATFLFRATGWNYWEPVHYDGQDVAIFYRSV